MLLSAQVGSLKKKNLEKTTWTVKAKHLGTFFLFSNHCYVAASKEKLDIVSHHILERLKIFISALVQKPFCTCRVLFKHSHHLLTQPMGCPSLCSELHWTAALIGWASHDQPDHSSWMSLATTGSCSCTEFRTCSCSLQLCTQSLLQQLQDSSSGTYKPSKNGEFFPHFQFRAGFLHKQ